MLPKSKNIMGEQITATGKERFEFALYLYTTKNMGIIQCAASFYQEKCKKYEVINKTFLMKKWRIR